MEIISTTVTRTARHKTEEVTYNIDYSTTDGRLDRVGLNVYRPSSGESGEEYLGTVHYDGHTVSCNLRWNGRLAAIFTAATDFISEIIASETANAPHNATTNNNTTTK